VILKAPLRAPVAVGLNFTLMLQLAPAANELPQVCVCRKSPALVPVIAMEVIDRANVPMLVRVTVLAALVVPTVTEPKLRLVTDNLAVVPIPLRGTNWGLPLALSVTLREALRAPVAVGLKVTLIVQLAAAANEAPQV
jgi:hypothetical protein